MYHNYNIITIRIYVTCIACIVKNIYVCDNMVVNNNVKIGVDNEENIVAHDNYGGDYCGVSKCKLFV